jgi:hypothetical protein
MDMICQELGCSLATLYNYIKRYGLFKKEPEIMSILLSSKCMVALTGAEIGVDAGIPASICL